LHAALKTTIAPAMFAILFAHLGFTTASHFAFNIADDFGLICSEIAASALPELRRGEVLLANGKTANVEGLRAEANKFFNLANEDYPLTQEQTNDPLYFVNNLPVFDTTNSCQSMNVMVTRNTTYRIRLDNMFSFQDGSISASKPFTSISNEAGWK